MAEEQMKKEDQLFIHLVNTFVQSAWISLGKVKNPVSDTLERSLEQATYYIDLLDMLQTKMKGNLSEWEEQYIIHSLSELKLDFIDEQRDLQLVAGFQLGEFGGAGGGVALETGRGVHDFQLDSDGQFDGDGVVFVEDHLDGHLLHQERQGVGH